MNAQVIETAKIEGIPFSIKMADGREYRVDRPEQIHIAKTHVVVIDNKTLPHILPLLTITGLSYFTRRKSGRRGARKILTFAFECANDSRRARRCKTSRWRDLDPNRYGRSRPHCQTSR